MLQQDSKRDQMLMKQFKIAQMKQEIQKLLQKFKQLEKEAHHNPKAAQRLEKMQKSFEKTFDQKAFIHECEQIKKLLKNPLSDTKEKNTVKNKISYVSLIYLNKENNDVHSSNSEFSCTRS